MSKHDPKPEAATTLPVDLTNPGQFFACCGILELANAVTPGAEGAFRNGQFTLSVPWQPLFQRLITCELAGEGEPDDKSPPVRFGRPFDLWLDWWRETWAEKTKLKTWAGGQTVLGFIDGIRRQPQLRAGPINDVWHAHKLERFASPKNEAGAEGAVADGKRKAKLKFKDPPKPFYFDARLSGLTSLDTGFSTENFAAALSPMAELLALVGLQRFRPETVEAQELYRFHTWSELLPASIAAAVASGLIPSLAARSYTFPLVIRTGDKYKAFGYAEAAKENHVGTRHSSRHPSRHPRLRETPGPERAGRARAEADA